MKPLVPLAKISLEVLARRCGVHPELIVRFVALGLIEPVSSDEEGLRFALSAQARLSRILRLHDELSLNYAAVGVVLELLERIDQLESALEQATARQEGA
jgi:chaperone modulatory protein CbpM